MNVVASVRSARSGRCRTDKSQSVKTPHLAVCRVVYHIRKTWIAMFYTHSPKVGMAYKGTKLVISWAEPVGNSHFAISNQALTNFSPPSLNVVSRIDDFCARKL